jgi:multisubunit Na+/H+ antiporter MnhG subunit
MMIYFILLLLVITSVFWIVQYALLQLTNDESNIELGINFGKKSQRFFRLRIKSKSLLSFWLQLLPWFFLFGLVIIVLTIGQYLGTDKDQITDLGKRLSGQMVGTIITLISTAILFLFITYVIERNTRQGDSEEDNAQLKKDRYRRNKELTILVACINVVVLALVINQIIGSKLPLTQLIFSIFCFILLLNLTAFTLSYGIRQRGLFKMNKALELKLKYLSNLRISISGNTSVSLWIQEGNQFEEGFLNFQRDILELGRLKSQLLNPNKRFKKIFRIWSKKDEVHSMSAERFGEMTKSPQREKQFFLRNFPELSYKIADTRNKLNEAKREFDSTKTRLTELRDGHSDYQNNLNDEIRGRKGQITVLQNTIFEIRQNNIEFSNRLAKQQKRLELEIMEGAELGNWTKDTLMKILVNQQSQIQQP